ncbi:MAG: DUF1257 domain-containing protein [Armatimonadetes bacterium]|nr:DUF1257 domain-containing protein [Armatimonadota bacterium]
MEHERHEQPVELEGWFGDRRSQKAEIVVRRSELNKKFTGLSNDLGFRWNSANESFDIVCSDYDMGMRIDNRVKQAYAAVAVERAMRRNDFRVETTFDNKRRLGDVAIIGKKLV